MLLHAEKTKRAISIMLLEEFAERRLIGAIAIVYVRQSLMIMQGHNREQYSGCVTRIRLQKVEIRPDPRRSACLIV
jgi:hypothetical protein